MSQDLTHLVDEIERIVTAPYAPSLQDLYTLLQSRTTSTVKCWALQKPCQIGLLADVLVESLSRSRIALPLLSIFVSEITFRDAVLLRHPVILDAFLQKAVDGGESEYKLACVSLLSSPFPAGLVPPARLANLITCFVTAMARTPNADTIAPLHTLMNGLQGCSLLQHDVPTEVMSNMQVEFTKTLRNLDDHMGNLLCLATFARIASIRTVGFTNKHGPEVPSWLLNIRQFFGPKRGLKTLDLVVLRVILACSSNCNNLTPPQAAESIQLAICIADAIEPEQKQAWISGNSSKIAKLCEKVARDGLDREIQMIGVAFLLSLLPAADLPGHIRELALHILVSKGSRGVMGVMLPHLIQRMAESLVCSEKSAVYHLLRFTFEVVQEGDLPGQHSLSDLQLANLILAGFQSSKSPVLFDSLLDSVSTRESVLGLLGSFPAKPKQTQCQGLQACSCAKNSLQNQLLIKIFDIYFAAALSRGGNNSEILVMKSFVEHVRITICGNGCLFSTAILQDFRYSVSLRNRQDFSNTEYPVRDWRFDVADVLMQKAQSTREDMIKKIEDVCVDLERRCYEVEGPLRSAEEERDRHIFEAETLKRRNEGLEKQLENSSSGILELQQNFSRLEQHAEKARVRAEEMSAALNSARQELDQQRRLAEEILRKEQDSSCARVDELSVALESARHEFEEQRRRFTEMTHQEQESARDRELDLLATCTEKDDQLEEQQEKLKHLKSEVRQMQQTLEEYNREQAISNQNSACLLKELAEINALFEDNKMLCSKKEDDIQRLLTETENMQMEIENMKTMIDEQNMESKKLCFALEEAQEESRLGLEATKQKYEIELTRATSENQSHKEEIGRLHMAMQVAAQNASKEHHSKDKCIHMLEKKIQSLRDERANKAREFSEAQQHIGRLMNVMGFTAKPMEPPASTQEPQPGTERRHPRNMRESACDDEESQLAESFDELASNVRGPSPKRSKANRLSMNPGILQSSTTSANGPSKQSCPGSTVQVVRRPLGLRDCNSPRKSQSSQPSKQGQYSENKLQAIDLDMDLEFSKDLFLSSTAFSGSNDQLGPQ
ncbi:uncharacterized protein N7484_007384 [Penicillium longicatenatum]|uniref:uncharacterized protein n=1 Tax=Penicillium longicatenatum TaxID=1561947 RepID=UPI002548D1A7|nr:uncharacterized protein N7484_007384 [Penicillium longicatenatum]KAJ5639522.1 hypothetical protein N7484_007384 [Penicillium longicatenatum]